MPIDLAVLPVTLAPAAPPAAVSFAGPQGPQVPADAAREPEYLGALQALLPWGLAWTRQPGAVLTRLLGALAHELACVDSRARDLRRESDPRTALEMLPDWERALALPDHCTGPLATVEARRAAAAARAVEVGGQSPAYFVSLAAALGFAVEVQEFDQFQAGVSVAGGQLTNAQRPFQAGVSVAGGELTNDVDWVFTWAVLAADFQYRSFLAGSSVAGEALASWGNALLECTLRDAAPAHTQVVFRYQRTLNAEPALVSIALPAITRT